ncbi:hypothetical protein K469DRAFT_677911 [Zopfia rhizophila CBS 207.26]|uniref:Lipocalin-like domain-containing protein n=1 Tax=Zopfia rhizophila CBS 207.26 TaxID=1314779 RepID=A0A6A6DDD1_9PEZI|nr:hypothetical protein K469DRAFT_677911 [Zopfia rhizophila CBS 207.26]
MAAPADRTIFCLTGRWSLNKSLSDSQDGILQHQGMAYFVRKAIAYANITVDVDQYTDGEGVVHVDSKQSSMGRVGSVELRAADWIEREQDNPYFGKISGRCRFLSREDQKAEWEGLHEWLREGWNDEHGFLESVMRSTDRGWVLTQIWGFGVLGGERRYVRRLVLEKGDNVLKCRLVYDWQDSMRRE